MSHTLKTEGGVVLKVFWLQSKKVDFQMKTFSSLSKYCWKFQRVMKTFFKLLQVQSLFETKAEMFYELWGMNPCCGNLKWNGLFTVQKKTLQHNTHGHTWYQNRPENCLWLFLLNRFFSFRCKTIKSGMIWNRSNLVKSGQKVYVVDKEMIKFQCWNMLH